MIVSSNVVYSYNEIQFSNKKKIFIEANMWMNLIDNILCERKPDRNEDKVYGSKYMKFKTATTSPY